MSKRVQSNITYTGRRGGGRRPFRRGPSTTALRRAGIIIPRRNVGYTRVGGYYGRYANGGELKFHDIDSNNSSPIPLAGVVQNAGTLIVIPQGVTEITRVGRKCVLKSIMWRWSLTLPETQAEATPPSPDTVRMMVFLDKQANGTTAAVLDILETANFQSFNNLSNSGRFKILYDKTITLNYSQLTAPIAASFATSTVIRNGTFFKKCNIPIEYSDTSGAMATIRSNNIGLLLISQFTKCSLDSKFRFRFSDA